PVLLRTLWRPRRRGLPAGSDPWDGRTLERWIPSPPPEHSFVRLPVVRARDTVRGLKYGPQAPASRPTLEPAPPDTIHPPSGSLFPIVLAAGLLLAGIGAVTRLAVVAIGFGVVVLAVVGFAFERPAFGEDESGEIA